jgi:hypothetical protein
MRGRDLPYFTGERFVRRRVGLQLLARTADSDESPRAARVPLAALFFKSGTASSSFAILAMTAFARVKVI